MISLRYRAGYRAVYNTQLPRMTATEVDPLGDILPKRSGLIVFDVGANHGIWARAFLDCYGDMVARMFLIEPLNGNNAIIDQRIKVGFFENFPEKIARLKFAAGGKDEEGQIHFEMPTSALASIVHTESRFGPQQVPLDKSQPVSIRTLASLMETAKVEQIDVLKMDTEGAELDILAGAEPLFAARKIGLASFEFGINHVRRRQTFRDVWDFFSKHGYRLFRLRGDSFSKQAVTQYSTGLEDLTRNWTIAAAVP